MELPLKIQMWWSLVVSYYATYVYIQITHASYNTLRRNADQL